MKRKLFQENTVFKNEENSEKRNDLDKLVEIQALALTNLYHAVCFDVKQLQEILGVGETNVYQLLRSNKLPSQTLGRRKVVPVAALAQFLVIGEKSFDKQCNQRFNTPTIFERKDSVKNVY